MKWLALVLTVVCVVLFVQSLRGEKEQTRILSPAEQCKVNIGTTGWEVIKFVADSKLSSNWPGYYVAPTIADKPLHCPSGSHYWYNREIAGTKETSPLGKVVLYCEVDDNDQPVFLHDGKMNVCFCDGHVEEVTPAQYQGLCWR